MSTRLPAHERKDQILDVALKVFATKGFHESSMNDIAEMAGVTKPVVYQHFESKRALFLALIEDAGTQMINEITKATVQVTGGRQQAEQGTVAFFRWASADQNRFKFLFDSGTRNDTEFASAVRNRSRCLTFAHTCTWGHRRIRGCRTPFTRQQHCIRSGRHR
jgi:AcrR family transcriptional regulator